MWYSLDFTGYAGMQIVPRFATNVYYNCVTGQVQICIWTCSSVLPFLFCHFLRVHTTLDIVGKRCVNGESRRERAKERERQRDYGALGRERPSLDESSPWQGLATSTACNGCNTNGMNDVYGVTRRETLTPLVCFAGDLLLSASSTRTRRFVEMCAAARTSTLLTLRCACQT